MSASKEKILVYMSGGVDSSVAAALLVGVGYDVTGAFMVDYDDPDHPGSCWHGDYEDALRVCAKLGIKLLRLDFRQEYQKLVLDYMYKEYEAGRTPNPDVLCNKYIKFGVWLEKAQKLGFDLVATGHYAQVNKKASFKLLEAKDKNKDQTYFLHQLGQQQLKQVLFPLGKYTKPEVRKLAKKFNLPTAEKEESMGICFVGEVPMKEFLQKKIKIKKGKIITSAGEILGEHDGLAFYTIGQRIGVQPVIPAKAGIQTTGSRIPVRDDNVRPLFVVAKDIKKNELIVGYENDSLLYKKEIQVGEINWISGHSPKFPLKCKVRLRHRQELQNCVILEKNNKIFVQFSKPERAPTPGQFAVFYLKGECLGGGIII
jgi:tRNA-uridine 2-sulfurtransferase